MARGRVAVVWGRVAGVHNENMTFDNNQTWGICKYLNTLKTYLYLTFRN